MFIDRYQGRIVHYESDALNVTVNSMTDDRSYGYEKTNRLAASNGNTTNLYNIKKIVGKYEAHKISLTLDTIN